MSQVTDAAPPVRIPSQDLPGLPSAEGHSPPSVAVVIPCYKVKAHILKVIEGVPPFVDQIYVVDDACPEGSGAHVEAYCEDARVQVLRLLKNQGVGGAVIQGYRRALDAGCEILVKLDGDGQMDPDDMADLIAPLVAGEADYAKGNRFYELDAIGRMPRIRIFGNAVLSFMAKLSTGYWDLFDPTNGYTALHATAARRIPWQKLSPRYFFETDLLFRLNTVRAAVVDVPMMPRYGDEVSNLSIRKIVGEFLVKHVRNGFKRVFYNYFLRDFSIASVELVAGVLLLAGGLGFGVGMWAESASSGVAQSAGTVMLAALPIMVGLQLILAFLNYDMASVPRRPLQNRFAERMKSIRKWTHE